MRGIIVLLSLAIMVFSTCAVDAQVAGQKPAEAAVKAKSSEAPTAIKKTGQSEAQAAYDEALTVAKKAGEIGDEGQAFLLYTDALLKLRKVGGKYPNFKSDEVKATIKKISDTLKGLEDAKCESLEKEKAGRFRFLVWKRQLLILNKLDKLEDQAKKNDDMLNDIKDKLGI